MDNSYLYVIADLAFCEIHQFFFSLILRLRLVFDNAALVQFIFFRIRFNLHIPSQRRTILGFVVSMQPRIWIGLGGLVCLALPHDGHFLTLIKFINWMQVLSRLKLLLPQLTSVLREVGHRQGVIIESLFPKSGLHIALSILL